MIHENPLRGQLHLPLGESRGKDAVWTQETYEQVLQVASPAFATLFASWRGRERRPSTIIRIEARHYNKRQSRWDCEDLYRGRSSTKKYVKHIRLLNDEARALVERLNAEHPEGPIFRNSFGNPWDADAPQIYLTNLQVKFQADEKAEMAGRPVSFTACGTRSRRTSFSSSRTRSNTCVSFWGTRTIR